MCSSLGNPHTLYFYNNMLSKHSKIVWKIFSILTIFGRITYLTRETPLQRSSKKYSVGRVWGMYLNWILASPFSNWIGTSYLTFPNLSCFTWKMNYTVKYVNFADHFLAHSRHLETGSIILEIEGKEYPFAVYRYIL